MIGALVIVFREVIEAGMIVGIVLAATRGVAGRGAYVSGGVGAGVAGAAIVAAFAGTISDAFEGAGQELLNAAVLAIAVVMLTWHNVWMARHGREIAAQMHSLGVAVSDGSRPLMALAVVVGAAVLREGAEVVLFLYGIVASGTTANSMLVGGLLGLAGGVALSGLTYFGLLAIPSRYIFSVTSVLIALLAAGMAAQSVAYLNAAGSLTILDRVLWDTSAVLPEDGIAGRLLHTLIGYTAQPTGLQLIAYAATLAVMAVLMRIARPRHGGTQTRMAAAE
jgi:high-affinity iron transporter